MIIENRKSVNSAISKWFIICLTFLVYSFLAIFIYLSYDIVIDPRFDLFVLCFTTALIFPKGFYFGVIIGAAGLATNIIVMSKIMRVSGDRWDLTYLTYYIIIISIIIISSFIGNFFHNKVILLITKKK